MKLLRALNFSSWVFYFWQRISIDLSIYPSIYLSIYLSMYVCMYVCMYVYMYACLFVCLYVCMYYYVVLNRFSFLCGSVECLILYFIFSELNLKSVVIIIWHFFIWHAILGNTSASQVMLLAINFIHKKSRHKCLAGS